MTDIPHFDVPFRFVGGHAVVNEQDSLEDISACVQAVARTFIGQRYEIPDFGIPDPSFTTQPLSVQELVNAVLEDEPRASVLMESRPGVFDQIIADIITRVSAEEVTG